MPRCQSSPYNLGQQSGLQKPWRWLCHLESKKKQSWHLDLCPVIQQWQCQAALYWSLNYLQSNSSIFFSNMWTMNFQMFKLVLEKAEEPEIKLPTFAGSLKKRESSRKTSTTVLLTMSKPLTVWITTNFKRWEYQTTWPASWETYMQVRKQHLELDMEQQTGSK